MEHGQVCTQALKLKTDLPFLEEKVDFGNLSMCSFHSKNYNSSNVAIAIFVTAYARIYIQQKKIEILNNNSNIYYSDTDSIVTDYNIPDN